MADEVPGFTAEEVAAAQAAVDADAAAQPEPVVETPAEPTPAPPPAPAAAPAEDEDDIPDVTTDASGNKMVPLSVVQATRRRAREVNQRFAELQGQVNAWRNAVMSQTGQSAPQQQQPTAPKVEDDPLGALMHTQKELNDLRAMVQGQFQQQSLQAAYVSAAQQFTAQKADFPDAYNYVLNSRANELKAFGATDQQVAAQLRADEQQMVQTALQAGRNPAEVLYAFAQARGYTGKAAEAPKPPAPAQPITPAPLLAVKAAAANPIAGGGKPPTAELTPQVLAGMNGKEFEKGWEKLFGSGGKSMFRN